jgi:hypothetical protein
MDLVGSGLGLIVKYYPDISLERLRKTTKTLSQGSQSPAQDFNPGTTEYEAGMLTTRPQL